MTLGKITIDNSVNYIPKNEQTRDIKPNRMKKDSLRKRQNKNNHKTIKNSLKT